MADAAETTSRPTKLPLLIGLVLALTLGGAGYYAVSTGLLFSGSDDTSETGNGEADMPSEVRPDIAFVPLQPLLVSIHSIQPAQQLRFEGHLEVLSVHASEVSNMMPRIMDVMNSYLRAIEVADIRDPSALLRIRAQLLRRIQVVTGEGKVRDLLVTTFLIS